MHNIRIKKMCNMHVYNIITYPCIRNNHKERNFFIIITYYLMPLMVQSHLVNQ
jgi:hypothetical protein